MLPPGLLERLELVAELAPGGDAAGHGRRAPPPDRPPRPARGGARGRSATSPAPMAGPGCCAGCVPLEEADGRVSLAWTLLGAGAGPALRALDPAPRRTGRRAAARLAAGERPAGRPLGPRQVDLLAELAAAPTGELPAADLAGRHGQTAVAGLVRRGLAEAEVRERPRRPLAADPPGGAAAARPPATSCPPRPRPSNGSRPRSPPATRARSCSTASPAAARPRSTSRRSRARSRPVGRRSCSCRRSRSPCPLVDRLRADLDARVALVHSGLGEGERADEWRRIRAGDVDIVVGTRLAVVAPARRRRPDHRRRGARRGLQERPDAAAPGARRRHPAGRAGRGGDRARVGDAGGRERRARRGPASTTGWSCRSGRSGRRRRRGRRPARGAGGRSARPPLALARRRRSAALDTAAGEQAILVLNRRGTASVVLCRDCGHVQACPDCERPLVYHQAGTTLRCHHCGRATPLASRCPSCGSPRIRYLGGGTGARRARGPRAVPRACASGGSTATSSSIAGAAERVVDAFAGGTARRPRRDEPRGQGPRHPVGDARRHRLVGRRAQPPRRARRRADLPAARPGDRSGRPRRAPRAGRSSRPTSPSTRRSRPPRPATGPRSTTPSWPCASGSGRRRSGGSSS